MRLKYQNPHRSIDSFPDIDLPAFSVLTGINGSGKSHILEAISRGSITSFVADRSIHTSQIKLFNASTFELSESQATEGHRWDEIRQDVIPHIERYRDELGSRLAKLLEKYFAKSTHQPSLEWLTNATPAATPEGLANPAEAEQFSIELGVIKDQARRYLRDHHLAEQVVQQCHLDGKSVFGLSEKEMLVQWTLLETAPRPALFTNAFSHSFLNYHLANNSNKYNRYLAETLRVVAFSFRTMSSS